MNIARGLWKIEFITSALLAGVIFCAGARANAPTGYDLVTINDRDNGRVMYLDGCTIYPEAGELVAWCLDSFTQMPAIDMPIGGPELAFGAMTADFAWWPSQHVCRLAAVDDMGSYTAYQLDCVTPLFNDGFEATP